MLGLSPWISLLAVFAAAWVSRLLAGSSAPLPRRLIESSWAPAVAGVLSASITLWAWGSLRRVPVLHDESAYLLQAELFARLRWSGAGRPLPDFFRQLYVLVDPVLASKYPPGHSLILAAGVVVGLPALPVIVMNAVSGALVFALARRLAGPYVALLTWLAWMTSFPAIYYHANYMSQATTSLMWLVAWWSMARWRDESARRGEFNVTSRWLVATAAAVAWCAITRPLTGLALGIVVTAVVLRRTWSAGSWRALAPATAAGLAILALLPLWSWRTTGHSAIAPLTVYTRTYVPFDKPGFGVAADARPSPRLPRDQWLTSAAFYQEHARHTLRALPRIARERIAMIAHDAWHEWRGGLQLCAAFGLLLLPLEGAIALAAFCLQFLLYLSYAHPARWTIYYVEGAPLLAFITALGIVRFIGFVSTAGRVADQPNAGPASGRRPSWWSWLRRAGCTPAHPGMAVAAGLLVILGSIAGVAVTRQVRAQIDTDHQYHEGFTTLLRRIPDSRALVFVRYGPKHLDGLSLVRNVPELEAARIWTVYDRGTDNGRLLRHAPDRAPYLFDETSWTLRRLQRPADSTRTSGVANAPTPLASTSRR